MNDASTIHERIAKRAAVGEAEVIDLLNRQAVPGRRPLASRGRLRVEVVHFAGIKSRLLQGETDQRSREPFSFTHALTTPLTAFATRDRNDAGKSSVLEMVLWAIRGASEVAADVRAWTHHVLVQLRVGGDRVVVGWTLDEQTPRGAIITLPKQYETAWDEMDASALRQMHQVAETGGTSSVWTAFVEEAVGAGGVIQQVFRDDQSFKAAVAEFMGERLGFERLDSFNKNKNATEDTDGHVVTHDWPLWSQALVIPKKTISSTLGEDPITASFVIETYLGTTWGPMKVAAKSRWKSLDADVASKRRAFERDDEAQKASALQMQGELQTVLDERATLPEADALNELDRISGELGVAAASLAIAEADHADALASMARLRGEVAVAEADQTAIREAALTDKFWHTLKPSCCPRCDAQVDAARWAREDNGQCSLCDSPLDLLEEPVTMLVAEASGEADDDSADEEQAAEDRVAQLAVILDEAFARVQATEIKRNTVRDVVVSLRRQLSSQSFNPAVARDLDLRIATLRGRLAERETALVRADDLADVERTITVLKATENEAERMRSAERGGLLDDVSSHLLEIGRRLGFRELESATFRGNGQLPVVKGGQKANFGALTDGEKLRLKIAIVIALLRVGTQAGVGRHPGLLVIDSPASEEMDPVDIKQMLAELEQIADETGLQVITSSAKGDLLLEALPQGSVRLPQSDDEPLW